MADRFTLPGLLSEGASAIAPVVDFFGNNPLRQIYNAAVPATNFLVGTDVRPIPLAPPPLPVQKLMRSVADVLGTDKPYDPRLDRYPPSPDGTPQYRTYTGSDTPINVPERPIPQMVQPVQMSQPVQPQSPAEAGIQKGGIAGLLGGAINRMMDRALYSTPTFGGNFITEQAGGEVALRRMESAAAQKQQEAALEAAKIQANLAKANKVSLDSNQTDLVLSVAEGQKVLNTIQEAKKFIAKSKLTGAGPQALQVAKSVLAAIGIDPGVSDITGYKQKVGEIMASVAKSKIFGRDLNKFDQKVLEKLITDPGVFNTDSQLLAQLNNFIKRTEADIAAKRRLLEVQNLGPATRFVIEGPGPQRIFRD